MGSWSDRQTDYYLKDIDASSFWGIDSLGKIIVKSKWRFDNLLITCFIILFKISFDKVEILDAIEKLLFSCFAFFVKLIHFL